MSELTFRKATPEDVAAIADVIAGSVRSLAKGIYDERQIELSIRTVFGVDDQLIADGTYFVAESDTGQIAGCGGWSKRKTLYGASVYGQSRDPELLDPAVDAAKIRAFFIHPDFARQGIGSAILEKCESEARGAGFTRAEMMATLPGVPLYSARGYTGEESVQVPVGDGVEIECIRMQKELI
jgi:GNAT superfamily N-acetyltransferase